MAAVAKTSPIFSRRTAGALHPHRQRAEAPRRKAGMTTVSSGRPPVANQVSAKTKPGSRETLSATVAARGPTQGRRPACAGYILVARIRLAA